MSKYRYPVVLSIAGSDSGGGAGIQADLKTMSALGCYGAIAITAVTAQNTLGISDIHPIPVEFVKAQIKAVMDDLKPSAIKIGMVQSTELAIGIASVLREYLGIPVVFDPVMVATSGDRLIANNTVETLKEQLFPLAKMVTPNLDEASILAEMEIHTIGDMKKATLQIMQYGCNAVLDKRRSFKGT
jgi:hydroxymethylpyrimidine/phosphomethylpyrimidine kinase